MYNYIGLKHHKGLELNGTKLLFCDGGDNLMSKNVNTADKKKFLKRTGYVMHQQFTTQQLYALPTLYLCVLYLSENKQRLVPLTA